MSGEKISILALSLVVVVLLFGVRSANGPNFGSNIRQTFDEAETISASTTLTTATGGVTIITNASNTGNWFTVQNIGTSNVFCDMTTATTGPANSTGQQLPPIGSSTANSRWTVSGYGGAVTCSPVEANVAVSHIFSGQ